MRVVIDTGVFIGAAIKPETAPSIAVYRAARRAALLTSHSTATGLMEVIGRPCLARLISPAARERLAALMAMAELVSITGRIAPFPGVPPAIFVQGTART